MKAHYEAARSKNPGGTPHTKKFIEEMVNPFPSPPPTLSPRNNLSEGPSGKKGVGGSL